MITTYKYFAIIPLLALALGVKAQNPGETKVIQTKRVRIEVTNVNGKLDTTITETIVDNEAMDSLNEEDAPFDWVIEPGEKQKPDVVETSWFVMDLGLCNWLNSNNSLELPEGYEDLELDKMSNNFHLGIIQQGVNLYKGKLRLVYGAGIEYNSYHFANGITIEQDSKPMKYTRNDDVDYSKNKLVSNYATVPVMLNFKSNPTHRSKSVQVAAGVQFGYLISAHQKQKWSEGNNKEKNKVKGDYGFEDYRMGYVAQFGYGNFVIYGKYYPTPTFKSDRGPDVNTACVGLVLSPF